MLLWAGSAPAAVRVLTPPDRAVLTDASLLILGTAPRGETVPWSVRAASGTTSESVKADWGDLFEIFVILEPGLNEFRIGDQRLRVFLDDGTRPVPPEFRPARTHAGDVSRCVDCHDRLSMEVAAGGYPGVCLSCHVVVSTNPQNKTPAQDTPHFRKAVANCGRCHEPHAALDPKLLRAPGPDLCRTCHPDRTVSETTHPALADEGCAACHDSHYSGYPKELHKPLPDQCQDCHDEGTGDRRRLHPPLFGKRSCATCHDPHADTPGLLVEAVPGLCLNCHGPVVEHGHGEELSACTDCHDPHDRTDRGLLAADPSPRCRECHEGIDQGNTVHPALEEGCQGCHDPHADDNRAKARASCAGCHDLAGDEELSALHGGLSIPPGACSRCHPPHTAAEDRLVKGRLHPPVAKGKCTVCHGGGAERSVKVADPAARCRMCHSFEKDLRDAGATPHDPVAEGDCTACHDPHMSDRPAFLKGPQPEVCGACHEEAEVPKGRARHPAAETCTDCHAAHGGTKRAFLATAPPDLCLDCHDDPAEGLAEPHPALEEGCLSCHDPHRGFRPGYTKGEAPWAACRDCHEVPALTAGTTLHTAAETCSNCHDPHGRGGPRYLEAQPPDLCLGCHDDPAEGVEDPHPALEDGCLVCHSPHEGFGGAALVQPQRELCLGCHDDPAEGLPKPHAPARDRCAGCHDPHGDVGRTLLRGDGPALCLRCHADKGPAAGLAVHPPAEEDCTNCHRMSGHGGEGTGFLAQTPPDLCLECHDDPREGAGELHPALEEGCLVCHDPHRGTKPGLLTGVEPNAPCLECHEVLTGKPVVHGALADGCSTCHDPHRADREHQLRTPGNALCRTCHDLSGHAHTVDAARGERFPGSRAFPTDGAEYRCTGCHAPHEADEKGLFVRPRAQLCQECHQI
ncbi:MAG: hypothetical protein D6708_01500 [Candidatus Dadabacteria bacterium]|nr:MAG: hypothetical protein D6708_01500 [Candidatus Dadabacteria bacterium]